MAIINFTCLSWYYRRLFSLKKVNEKFLFNMRVVSLAKEFMAAKAPIFLLKLILAGVMPVIFAGAVLNIPLFSLAILS